MAVERHYRMVGEESARQKREREERERREKLEAEEKAEKARKEAVVWRIVWIVCCIGWMVFTVSRGLPWYIVVIGSLIGGTLSMVLIWMTIHLFDGNDNDHHSGGASSGVEWDRLANWYVRGATRRQMRKLGRW